jgi:hypothetical protein
LSRRLSEEGLGRQHIKQTAQQRELAATLLSVRYPAASRGIRTAQDPPDFLENTLDATAILRAAECGGAGHALVYLAATPWGGVAATAFSANPLRNTHARFAMLDLPFLTDALINSLNETTLDDETRHIIGGYAHAQEGNGFDGMWQQWAGKTFREMATALHVVFRLLIAQEECNT